jgi:tRNA threonylcarbamoyladenosine biosynthesis protein TsaB
MNLLGIDTATEACSVALWRDGTVSGRHAVAGRSHSELLRPMVAEVLAEAGLRAADIDAFACGIGPGSFAGVRIGVAFVQGMAAALDRPVVALTSLELLAMQGIRSGCSSVLPAIDARMNEVYVAFYTADADGWPRIGQPAQVCPANALAQWQLPLQPQLGIGSGWSAHGDALAAVLGGFSPLQRRGGALPDIADGMGLAAHRLQDGSAATAMQLQPLYLRNKVALTVNEQLAMRKAGRD